MDRRLTSQLEEGLTKVEREKNRRIEESVYDQKGQKTKGLEGQNASRLKDQFARRLAMAKNKMARKLDGWMARKIEEQIARRLEENMTPIQSIWIINCVLEGEHKVFRHIVIPISAVTLYSTGSLTSATSEDSAEVDKLFCKAIVIIVRGLNSPTRNSVTLLELVIAISDLTISQTAILGNVWKLVIPFCQVLSFIVRGIGTNGSKVSYPTTNSVTLLELVIAIWIFKKILEKNRWQENQMAGWLERQKNRQLEGQRTMRHQFSQLNMDYQ